MDRESLKQYLSKPYQGAESFLENIIFPVFGEDRFNDEYETELLETNPELQTLADSTGIKSVKQIGTIYFEEPIQIFDITVSDRIQMQRNRVGIQQLIRRAMDTYSFSFMLFHYNDKKRWDWRFTFCHKLGSNNEGTDRKRYTFLLGPGQSCRTAADNFIEMFSKRDTLAMSDIEHAFSVEALSDEFFDKYKKHYEDILLYVTGKKYVKKNNKWVEVSLGDPCEDIMPQFAIFSDPEKAVRDYVKKLMGRIVFLFFLQKKGWLGVPKDKKWGEGDQEFIQNLFAKCTDKNHFVDTVLGVLFNDLNTERKDDISNLSSLISHLTVKVPYLNGGLFEPDAADNLSFPLPAKFLQNFLGFLAEYNFTIDENDPDDAEVGVDPEMLGRIFENLLEDNKDKGAFYTPKEIVSYMCRESLIAYLQTDIEDEPTCKDIRDFVMTHDAECLGAYREYIDEQLCKVKICDPAIGSGAFPMGLLKELFQCRSAIEGFEPHKAALIKKHIIQQNIYGVDIERGAVDIARLRFWLSLIVDEETPQALPNLDFKIMQGNSLLEQYEGINLSTMTEKKEDESGMLTIFDDMLDIYRKKLCEMLSKYYDCTDHKEKQRLQKNIIENVIKQLDEQGVTYEEGDPDLSGNDKFMLWHTWFYDVFAKGGFDIVIGNPPYLESRSPKFSNELKNNLQREIAKNRPSDSTSFPRGADLLIFFYELSLRILNEKGYNVFITENSWLSTDYGSAFQQFLLNKCTIHAIIDSEYKYFESADVNTVITIFKNKTNGSNTSNVKFYYCDDSLEKYPCNSFMEKDSDHIQLKMFESNDRLLTTYKWSVIFKADIKLLHIMESLYLYEDRKVSSKISIGQGLNLIKDDIFNIQVTNTYPYYTSDIGATYSWNKSNHFVHKADISHTRKVPQLIMPRGIGTHFCSVNECLGYTSSYVEVYGNLSKEELLNIWLFCNSSLFWLLREISGRTNLGGGMLKAEATDLKCIPLCYSFNRYKDISSIYNTIKNQTISTDLSQTLNNPYHSMIDAIVLDYLGLEKEKDFIQETLLNCVNGRIKKSKT